MHEGMDLFFQFGMDRIDVVFDGKDMEQLRELAADLIASKYPQHFRPCVVDSMLLFKHNYHSVQQLENITSVDMLDTGDTIEIILKVNYMMMVLDNLQMRPHTLNVHSYKTPTFCDLCSEMLFGLIRQGLKCDGCGGNFHKRCAFKIPNNCKGVRGDNNNEPLMPSMSSVTRDSVRRISEQWSIGDMSLASDTTTTSSDSPQKERRATWAGGNSGPGGVGGRPFLDPVFSRLEIPHTFMIHSYKRPTVCHVCKRLLKGLFRQGLQCKDCKFNCHKRCESKAPRSCDGESSILEGDDDSTSEHDTLSENLSHEDEYPTQVIDEEQQLSPTAENPLVETMSTNTPNIQLQRLVMSVRYKRSRGSKVLKVGWMVYFTKSDSVLKTHFWRLDTKSIIMYETENTDKEVKTISLHGILSIDSNVEAAPAGQARHLYLFILKTNDEVYYCGQRDEFDQNGAIVPFETSTGKGTKNGIAWAVKIREAYQPVSNTAKSELLAPKPQPMKQRDLEENSHQDISEVYQVFSDEILGSGQFGTVFSGVHRQTGSDVAVKVIDKNRFPTKEERALKNEVRILQTIDHPAVVNLERMFETPDRIFVVMEKMKGDMLEMILNSPKGRLTEHQTKVIVYQILIALKFLHSQDIVHCDLKPENVLLSGIKSQSGMPQIKLCDFGFARIIGQESFRRSVVGTPAYLAPEVLNNRKYNRNLDMWSVGVVIYVSVSGTFPFNEEEEIADQIKNAAFMYPPNPWAEISQDARDLIDKLLQVKINSRLAPSGALLHVWMQDYYAYLELRSLDEAVGRRYLTHESDDRSWAQWEQMQQQHPVEHV